MFYTRGYVEFFIESDKDDIDISPVDNIFGVQLNKNQNNQDNLPKPLARLIEVLIEKFHLDVWNYFEDRIDSYKKQLEIKKIQKIYESCAEIIDTAKNYIDNSNIEVIQGIIKNLGFNILQSGEYTELVEINNDLKKFQKLFIDKFNELKQPEPEPEPDPEQNQSQSQSQSLSQSLSQSQKNDFS